MSFWTVTLVSLVIGMLLVIGGALVMYMGSLVKNAYQLKVEIQSDMETGLRRMEEESEKKTRWIKRDLVEEIEKIKTALQTDNQRRQSEMAESLARKITELEEAQKQDRQEVAKLLDSLRQDIMVLDQRQKALRRDQKAAQPAAEATASTPAAPESAAAEPEPPPPAPPSPTDTAS